MAIEISQSVSSLQPAFADAAAFTCPSTTREALRHITDFSPEDIFKIASCSLPDVESGSVERMRPGRHPVDIYKVVTRGAGFCQDFLVNFEHRIVTGGYIGNTRKDRSTGRIMYAQRAILGIALGFDRLEIHASHYMGGLVWAKAGLYPDDHERPQLCRSFAKRARILDPHLDRETGERLSQIITLRERASLWSLAAMDETLSMPSHDFSKAMYETGQDYSCDEYAGRGFIDPERITIAQFMLCGQSYTGHHDLKDKKQMAMLEDYTCVPVRRIAQSCEPV